MITDTTSVADAADRAVCPGCHTRDGSMTMAAVASGEGWRCSRCTQQWDGVRLATVANYAAWMAARTLASAA